MTLADAEDGAEQPLVPAALTGRDDVADDGLGADDTSRRRRAPAWRGTR